MIKSEAHLIQFSFFTVAQFRESIGEDLLLQREIRRFTVGTSRGIAFVLSHFGFAFVSHDFNPELPPHMIYFKVIYEIACRVLQIR